MHQFNLSQLFASARTAQGSMAHIGAGMDVPHAVTSKPATASQFLDLRELSLPALMNGDGVITSSPAAEPAAKSKAVAAAIVASSLVAQAGAHIIIAAERPAPSMNELATYRDAGALVIVEPAAFAGVADGQNVATSALPLKSAAITWPDAPSVAFSTKITRNQMKTSGYDVEAAVSQAILLGLARAADKTLLQSIVAANPVAFSLGAAAARGLEFAELRALIGTDAAGALVGENGALRAAGVLGELTPTIAETVVGAFSRSGVAVHPNISIHVKRMSVAGDLEITAFANMLALVPDASAFWKAV